ncbi:MAG: NAD(P)H-hydrate dehydratase [Bacteroidia bacterium]|nr:NAD(P)H-hydrate dehydratase [Bacteroidia bacterium]
MKIFTCDQIRQIDDYTIRNEPVASVDLMERAAGKLLDWYTERFVPARPVYIFTGPGNNGGDGLALARMLSVKGYKPSVFFTGDSDNTSADWKINRSRLADETKVPFETITGSTHFPSLPPDSIIIDALFGSGLSRPVKGVAADVIGKINVSGLTIISIDMPSGLFGEDNSGNDNDVIVKASYTLSFQFPKLSFMFPENEKFAGQWQILPIGLDKEITERTETPYRLLDIEMVKPLLKVRNKFDHKGSFGHGLLAGGSYGRMGAVVLGSRAALRAGIGLVTCHIPSLGNLIIQCAVPEAMAVHDKEESVISDLGDLSPFSAVGIGPGMGTEKATQNALHEFLLRCNKPVVIDADALNILSENKTWFKDIPPIAILTPHLKEFERLAGKTNSGFDRIGRQIEFSANHNCIVVLKGAHTSITGPGGMVCFNSSGNPGMATAGSGDTLTGIILALLAQGYEPENAALLGVFLHGLAGDIAAVKSSCESLIASDIIDSIGEAFNRIRE